LPDDESVVGGGAGIVKKTIRSRLQTGDMNYTQQQMPGFMKNPFKTSTQNQPKKKKNESDDDRSESEFFERLHEDVVKSNKFKIYKK
jgi:hypothetical protein